MEKDIDKILLSIENNQQTIADMLNTAKETNKKINSEMHRYAATRSCLNKEQMTAYAEYARAYDNVKKLYDSSDSHSVLDNINKIHNDEITYILLDNFHAKQLGFMEYLCSMIEKARVAIRILCPAN